MDAIPMFLNDGSYPSSSDDRSVSNEVIELLKTLRGIKGLDREFIVGTAVKLSDVPINSAYQRLASLASLDKEWWRFIKGLDQRTPFSEVPQCLPPHSSEHVVSDSEQSTAALWVDTNNAFLVSFPSSTELRQEVVTVGICSCMDGSHAPNNASCRNLSVPAHVEVWRDALLDFSFVEAASSTIYECESFRLKMYLNDHSPPHVHVYQSEDPGRCVGKVRFDHVEVLQDSGLSRAVRRDVLALVAGEQSQFLRGWERCRAGSHPNRIQPS